MIRREICVIAIFLGAAGAGPATTPILPQPNEPLESLRALVAKGDTSAMIRLAYLELKERGPEAMPDAVALYRQAADAGNAQGMAELGQCYSNGWALERDLDKAIALFRKAAALG